MEAASPAVTEVVGDVFQNTQELVEITTTEAVPQEDNSEILSVTEDTQPAPQSDVIYPQFGVPDVTIPATKWIDGNEQQPAPEQPVKKKKKGKLALIISLSAVAVLIGVAIGLAFLF